MEQVRWQHQDMASILARKESESQALAGRRDRVSAVLCAATVCDHVQIVVPFFFSNVVTTCVDPRIVLLID